MVPSLFKKKKAILLSGFFLLTLLFLVAYFRVPVRINPKEITACPCYVTDNEIFLQPQGFSNPHKKKHWKVTARYNEEESTLYVSCWLKADLTFSGFGYQSRKLDRKQYGKIERMVLVGGGLIHPTELVIWENGTPTLP